MYILGLSIPQGFQGLCSFAF